MHNIITQSLFGAIVMPTIIASSLTTNPAMIAETVNADKLSIQTILDSQKENTELTKEEKERLEKAAKIDAYFAKRNLPLAGHGMGMVLAAEKYGLDYRMLPAIAMRETTGGLKACPVTYQRTGDIGYKHNVFGWGSCSIRFDSYEDAFDTLAKNLTGNNPRTARYYKGKDTISILESYNPRHIVRDYPEQVVAIMDAIEKTASDDGKELAMSNTKTAN